MIQQRDLYNHHHGAFAGIGDDTFVPNQRITCGELAAVLVRFMHRGQIGPFEAPHNSDWFNGIAGH